MVSRQRIVRIVLVLSLYAALFFIPFFDRRGIGVLDSEDLIRWVGTVLSTFGFSLVFFSGLALGRLYSADVTIQKEHQLITNGVFRFIRHPRYLGVIALSIGISCIFRSWIGLAVSIIFIAILLFRIRDEEDTLRKEFSEDWDKYCMHSWRLVPYIY